MKNLYKNEQTGRSMVEMLGVLAIIGVLSVGGIAGYSKAMAKFKLSKAMDQVAMLVANIRTLYSGQRNYAGLSNSTAISYRVVPDEMVQDASGSVIINAFAGTVNIEAVASNSGVDNGAFYVAYNGLGREACINLAIADWGSGSGSGLEGMTPSAAEGTGGDASDAEYNSANLPITLENATTDCSCTATASCSVTWWYF